MMDAHDYLHCNCIFPNIGKNQILLKGNTGKIDV